MVSAARIQDCLAELFGNTVTGKVQINTHAHHLVYTCLHRLERAVSCAFLQEKGKGSRRF